MNGSFSRFSWWSSAFLRLSALTLLLVSLFPAFGVGLPVPVTAAPAQQTAGYFLIGPYQFSEAWPLYGGTSYNYMDVPVVYSWRFDDVAVVGLVMHVLSVTPASSPDVRLRWGLANTQSWGAIYSDAQALLGSHVNASFILDADGSVNKWSCFGSSGGDHRADYFCDNGDGLLDHLYAAGETVVKNSGSLSIVERGDKIALPMDVGCRGSACSATAEFYLVGYGATEPEPEPEPDDEPLECPFEGFETDDLTLAWRSHCSHCVPASEIDTALPGYSLATSTPLPPDFTPSPTPENTPTLAPVQATSVPSPTPTLGPTSTPMPSNASGWYNFDMLMTYGPGSQLGDPADYGFTFPPLGNYKIKAFIFQSRPWPQSPYEYSSAGTLLQFVYDDQPDGSETLTSPTANAVFVDLGLTNQRRFHSDTSNNAYRADVKALVSDGGANDVFYWSDMGFSSPGGLILNSVNDYTGFRVSGCPYDTCKLWLRSWFYISYDEAGGYPVDGQFYEGQLPSDRTTVLDGPISDPYAPGSELYCTNPLYRTLEDDLENAASFEFTGVQRRNAVCVTLVPGTEFSIAGYSFAWSQVSLCPSYFVLPQLAYAGVSLPSELLFVLPMGAAILRLLRSM